MLRKSVLRLCHLQEVQGESCYAGDCCASEVDPQQGDQDTSLLYEQTEEPTKQEDSLAVENMSLVFNNVRISKMSQIF